MFWLPTPSDSNQPSISEHLQATADLFVFLESDQQKVCSPTVSVLASHPQLEPVVVAVAVVVVGCTTGIFYNQLNPQPPNYYCRQAIVSRSNLFWTAIRCKGGKA